MRHFGEAQSISGYQILQLMRRPYVGKCVRCHVSCLIKVPRGQVRQNKTTSREWISPPPQQGGIGDNHLKAYHDLQTRLKKPRKATQLGDRGSLESLVCSKKFLSYLSKKQLIGLRVAKSF